MNSLLDVLALERIEENIFRGQSEDIGTGQVYGGQVLGQALRAAEVTCDGREPHSLHAYFLRKGDFNQPVVYEVDRGRDGRSFSARRVVAIQQGRPIFLLAASFQRAEEGLDYAQPIELPARDGAGVFEEKAEQVSSKMPIRYFHFKTVKREGDAPPLNIQSWVKSRETLPDDPEIHRTVLAYLSDLRPLPATLLPHGIGDPSPVDPNLGIVMASIDHAIWFHRPFRADEWLLYHCEPVSTSGGRGLARGSIYREDGTLVASIMQEGLIRKIDQG